MNGGMLIIILKSDFTESVQYREKCFWNGNKLDKWRNYLVKSTGRNHYSNRYERKLFLRSFKRLKISCTYSSWSSRKVNSVFRHWNTFQPLITTCRIITFWTQKGPSYWVQGPLFQDLFSSICSKEVAWIWFKSGSLYKHYLTSMAFCYHIAFP